MLRCQQLWRLGPMSSCCEDCLIPAVVGGLCCTYVYLHSLMYEASSWSDSKNSSFFHFRVPLAAASSSACVLCLCPLLKPVSFHIPTPPTPSAVHLAGLKGSAVFCSGTPGAGFDHFFSSFWHRAAPCAGLDTASESTLQRSPASILIRTCSKAVHWFLLLLFGCLGFVCLGVLIVWVWFWFCFFHHRLAWNEFVAVIWW